MQVPDHLKESYIGGQYGGTIEYKFVEKIRKKNPPIDRPMADLMKVELKEKKIFATLKYLMKLGHVSDFEYEISLVRGLTHKNISKFMGSRVDMNDRHISYMTEYATLGPLDELIQTKGALGLFNIDRFFSLSTQACKGLSYLHEEDVIHGAICSRNIFATKKAESGQHDPEEGNWVVIIGEFEAAKQNLGAESSKSKTKTNKDILRWQPLEVLKNAEISKPSDVWSLLVFFGELLLKKTVPFEDIKGQLDNDIVEAIEDGITPFKIHEIPEALQDLFRKSWDTKPNNRDSVQAVYEKLVGLKVDMGIHDADEDESSGPVQVSETESTIEGAVGGAPAS